MRRGSPTVGELGAPRVRRSARAASGHVALCSGKRAGPPSRVDLCTLVTRVFACVRVFTLADAVVARPSSSCHPHPRPRPSGTRLTV